VFTNCQRSFSIEKRGATTKTQVAHGLATPFVRTDRGPLLTGYLVSNGRLTPSAIITVVICGILIYAAFFHLA
jgi:hypothetical protein